MISDDDLPETWTIAIDADTTALAQELRAATSLGRQFGTALSTAFQGIAIKGKSVSDVLRSLALRLSDLTLRAALKPLEQGFGNLLSGLVSGSFGGAGSAAPSLPVPFATGGVIRSPVTFPLANGRMGLAGERGAEAILPLARGPDGRLGVAASGGGRGIAITLNVATPDAESFRRSEAQLGAILARAAALGQRNA
ncbi:MAG: phage tail tape measure protein [Hyphomicrobium sp.]|nr:phage tail tape measure protein [Hyphomicrobium sp.]